MLKISKDNKQPKDVGSKDLKFTTVKSKQIRLEGCTKDDTCSKDQGSKDLKVTNC